MNVNDKIAIVTGAGQGIGLEICRRLIDGGAKVVMNDIDADLVMKAARPFGERCSVVAGDSSDQYVIDTMIKTAVDNFGQLNIVIANAGITLYGEFFNYSREDFFKVMQVNLGGTFFLAQAAAREMKKHSGGGSLLFMSSVTGHQAHRNLAAYGMTKAAIEMLAKHLVIELSVFKININAIAPGATATERTLEDEQYRETWSRITPLGRPAGVGDIANAALFLVSDEARHITGQTLVVDGGWTSVSPSPYH